MSQTAKKWLANQDGVIKVRPVNGGIVGSLISLGFVQKEVKIGLDGAKVATGKYEITREGKEWIRNQKR